MFEGIITVLAFLLETSCCREPLASRKKEQEPICISCRSSIYCLLERCFWAACTIVDLGLLTADGFYLSSTIAY